MPGGLLQIASFGSQDIFLTGNPEITYFKYVYRRYTNFSMETLEEFPDGIVNFNEKINFTLSKNADLAHKVYLKIELPKVDLIKVLNTNDVNTAKNNYEDSKTNWNNLNKYSNYIIGAYNLVYAELQPINADPLAIYNKLEAYFINDIDYNDYQTVVNTIKPNIITNTDIRTKVATIVNGIQSRDTKIQEISKTIEEIKKYLENKNYIYYEYNPNLPKKYPNQDNDEPPSVLYTKEQYLTISTPRYNFAWINNLGHYIIKQINIEIGGTVIDRHYNDWINIWYELTKSTFKIETYNKMIGNIPELTTYNNQLKSAYTLYLPLSFWFNQYNGISLPLVCLKYQDVKINIEFNELINCIRCDYKNINIENLIKLSNVSLYVDYIYLDQIERKKFAYGIHEYIIPQIQTEIFRDNTNSEITCAFNTMYPTKEMIWVVQKNINRSYNTLDTYINWANYNFPDALFNGNPVKNAYIELSGYERFKKIDGNYFNYVQPYEFHSSTPSDGINVYSFSLKPEDNQPSGSCNMTRHEAKNLRIELTDEFMQQLGANNYVVKIYSLNYNILRFMGGLSSLAFLY
jgi:hypothetical protein